ncbi:hypothetical protein TEA_026399 [Camellia sinensis var. sinensis]|uniref:Plastid lipid-associated protein/fibrillin conserved domain-containing protein n=1 Tax=Camellia sinensis var. sinensis TaxID=542762 RepID=A0A4V3WL32_CAMSN|nr:hypothetical protein TEA_026399 [Camellia sinensis var. sinensis]
MALSSHSHTILTTTPSSSSHSLPKLLHLPQHHSLSFPIKPTTTQYTQNLSTTTTSPVSDKWRTHVSFFPAFLNKTRDAKPIKEELLEAIAPLDRGADATPEDQQRIDQFEVNECVGVGIHINPLIARKLEAVNPTKEPLKSDLLNGKWELIYTTSKSILQTQVTADLTPLNARKVAVKFDFFKIGGVIPIKAPGRARGELEITYLDEELRVSRGDKGNLFILKMIDPSYRVPVPA